MKSFIRLFCTSVLLTIPVGLRGDTLLFEYQLDWSSWSSMIKIRPVVVVMDTIPEPISKLVEEQTTLITSLVKKKDESKLLVELEKIKDSFPGRVQVTGTVLKKRKTTTYTLYGETRNYEYVEEPKTSSTDTALMYNYSKFVGHLSLDNLDSMILRMKSQYEYDHKLNLDRKHGQSSVKVLAAANVDWLENHLLPFVEKIIALQEKIVEMRDKEKLRKAWYRFRAESLPLINHTLKHKQLREYSLDDKRRFKLDEGLFDNSYVKLGLGRSIVYFSLNALPEDVKLRIVGSETIPVVSAEPVIPEKSVFPKESEGQ